MILDFSNPAALPGLLAFAQEHKIPCVIATTGMDEAHQKMIADASKVIPIFFTFNMSLGVNLLCALEMCIRDSKYKDQIILSVRSLN